MLLSIEIYRTCDFPGRGSRHPITHFDPRMDVGPYAYKKRHRNTATGDKIDGFSCEWHITFKGQNNSVISNQLI